MKMLYLVLLLIPAIVQGGEKECLSQIMWQESRGEPLEGILAVGQASISKANREHTSVCKLRGVQRSTPHKDLAEYYVSLANQLIIKPSTSISKGGDHWDTGVPHMPGHITRKIGHHTFYILKGH
jgi:hypothetical protein